MIFSLPLREPMSRFPSVLFVLPNAQTSYVIVPVALFLTNEIVSVQPPSVTGASSPQRQISYLA